MKKQIHPKYQEVLFIDSTTNYKFVCGSTMQPKETDTFNGKEYPVYRLSTSSASHPFFTGSKALVDAEGRVDKFKKRYSANSQKNKDAQDEASKEGKEEAPKAPAKKTAKKK